MAKLKNISPLGDLEIPWLGITVAAGDTFDVDDETSLLALAAQAENFEPVDKAAKVAAAKFDAGRSSTEPASATDPSVNSDDDKGQSE